MRTGAEDLLMKFFFLIGMEVGLSLFKNVDPSQKDFQARQEHALPSVRAASTKTVS